LLVDSHCHLNYLDNPQQALQQARDRGVGKVLCISVDRKGIDAVLALAASETGVWASAGQHPEAADQDWQWIEQFLTHAEVVAVGETGLDYHHVAEPEKQARQRACFEHQLGLARQYSLPVVVHTRAAQEDTLALMRAHPGVIGVLHCFTESWDMARQALELGYYISISGIVTFRNGENVREVARQVPDDRLLLETDAPWLAPVPHRGHTNQPAFVADTAAFVADLRHCSVEDLAALTHANFERLFSRVQNSSSNSR
jgi:TatD DNase family protein